MPQEINWGMCKICILGKHKKPSSEGIPKLFFQVITLTKMDKKTV